MGWGAVNEGGWERDEPVEGTSSASGGRARAPNKRDLHDLSILQERRGGGEGGRGIREEEMEKNGQEWNSRDSYIRWWLELSMTPAQNVTVRHRRSLHAKTRHSLSEIGWLGAYHLGHPLPRRRHDADGTPA